MTPRVGPLQRQRKKAVRGVPADAAVAEGIRLFNSGRFQEAAAVFAGVPSAASFLEQALASAEGHGWKALLEKGRCLQAEEDWDGAAAAFAECARQRPQDAEAWLGLAEVDFDRGRLRQARAALLRAARAPHARPLVRYRVLIRQGRLEQAFALGRRLRREDRGAETAAVLGWPWAHVVPPDGGAKKALAADHAGLARHARRRPGDAWGHYYLGILSRRLGRDNGLEELERAVALGGAGDEWMTFELGRALLYDGRFRPALGVLARAAAATTPPAWMAYAYRSEAYACLRDAPRALSEIGRAERAAATTGDKADARAWQGQMELWLGRPRQALATLDAAAAQGARYAFGWRGAAKIRLGQPRAALPDLDEAIRLKRWDLEAWVWRGEAKRLLGDLDGAERDLSHAVAQDEDPWALMNRALIHAARGRRDLMEADAGRVGRRLLGAIRRRLSASASLADVLEAGLRINGGLRRGAGYACAVWFDLTEDSPAPGPAARSGHGAARPQPVRAAPPPVTRRLPRQRTLAPRSR